MIRSIEGQKVDNLEVKALRIQCAPDKWKSAIRNLINKADEQGLTPSTITITRIVDMGSNVGEDTFDITLWGA